MFQLCPISAADFQVRSALTLFCLALMVVSSGLLSRILRTKALVTNTTSGLRIYYYYAFKPDVVSILEVVWRII